MGLSGEKGPLGELKGKKEKGKKRGEAPWALGPMRGAPPPPLGRPPPLSKGTLVPHC
jgi:hypothetical protein